MYIQLLINIFINDPTDIQDVISNEYSMTKAQLKLCFITIHQNYTYT